MTRKVFQSFQVSTNESLLAGRRSKGESGLRRPDIEGKRRGRWKGELARDSNGGRISLR